jgi:hypothetical protein
MVIRNYSFRSRGWQEERGGSKLGLGLAEPKGKELPFSATIATSARRSTVTVTEKMEFSLPLAWPEPLEQAPSKTEVFRKAA